MKCGFYMNVATGTFGSGIPENCPECHKTLDYEVVGAGWNAEELNKENDNP